MMTESIGEVHHRFHDFRSNGLLLPCQEDAALRLGLPLHRGPHRRYSHLVAERIGQIEATWAKQKLVNARLAAVHAQMRLDLLQKALRRYLLEGQRRRLVLNRSDPAGAGPDFGDLDAMADLLWGATTVAEPLPHQQMDARVRKSSLAA